MRKVAKVAVCSLAAIIIAVAGAVGGFYLGMRVGSTAIHGIAENNKENDDFSEIRSSMVALGKGDLSLSQHQLAIHLRVALFDLGALSKSSIYIRCTEKDRHALADAANYVQTHPDPILFGPDPLLTRGIRFCDSRNDDQKIFVSYMTTGQK